MIIHKHFPVVSYSISWDILMEVIETAKVHMDSNSDIPCGSTQLFSYLKIPEGNFAWINYNTLPSG